MAPVVVARSREQALVFAHYVSEVDKDELWTSTMHLKLFHLGRLSQLTNRTLFQLLIGTHGRCFVLRTEILA